jgi:hypothetical protein
LVLFYVSALNVQFTRLLAAVRRPHTYAHALDLWQFGFIVLSGGLSIAGASVGYTYAGAGEGVDPALGALLSHVALACVVVTCTEFGLLLLLLVFVVGLRATHVLLRRGTSLGRRKKSTLPEPLMPLAPVVDLWVATLHAPAAGFGLVGALVPVAGVSMVALVVMAFVVAVAVLPILLFHVLVMLGLLMTSANKLHYPVVHMALLAVQTTLAGLSIAGAYLWVYVPFMEASSAAYDLPTVQSGSAILVCVIALGVAFKFGFECVSVLWHLRRKTTKKI